VNKDEEDDHREFLNLFERVIPEGSGAA
jgi:hypothetical protein